MTDASLSWQARSALAKQWERFEAKIVRIPESGCWIWIASLDSHGYGQIVVQGKHRRAHQVAYVRANGPVPPGLELDHLCRVPSCCNPYHLEAVTHRENILRSDIAAIHRARAAKITHCPQGHEYAGANLRMSGTSRYCRQCSRDAWNESYRCKRLKRQK